MMERLKSEPVMVMAVLEATLAAIVAFGFDLSGEQVAAIVGVASAVLGLVARSQVTPTRNL